MSELSEIDFNIKWNGDSAITLFFNEKTSEQLSKTILSLTQAYQESFKDVLLDIIPAYQSLTLYFDLLKVDLNSIEDSIIQIIKEQSGNQSISIDSKLIEIPVCYNEAYAPDLADFAEQCQLSIDEVKSLHTAQDYLVNMLGFLPGFLYLSGLNTQLHCPRKTTPSLKVPAGAVAIGGKQTGIYPVESPGGWHVIGRTPISIFKPDSKYPFIAQPLDKIRFVSINEEEFIHLNKAEG